MVSKPSELMAMILGVGLVCTASAASAGRGSLLSSAQFIAEHVPLPHSFLSDMRLSFVGIGWNFQG